MKKLIALLGLTLLLNACGAFHNRNDEYLKAPNNPEITLPNGVKSANWKQSYPIPKGNTTNAKPVDMMPPGLAEDQKHAVDSMDEP